MFTQGKLEEFKCCGLNVKYSPSRDDKTRSRAMTTEKTTWIFIKQTLTKCIKLSEVFESVKKCTSYTEFQ